MKHKILLHLFLMSMFISNTFSQTSLYGTVGVGKTEIKRFETGDLHFGNSFNPGLFKQYEVGFIHEFPKGFSVKLGGGLTNYACVIASSEAVQEAVPDNKDTRVDFYYISVPFGVRYNPLLNLRVEAGLINNFFSSTSQEGTHPHFQGIKEYDKFKKYNPVPYWGLSYTFFDQVELGFTDHLYLSNFAAYTDPYAEKNGIEPSVFFKYNSWDVYVSYKIKLSKRD